MSGYNIAKIKGVKIAGLSACVPSHVTDNMKEGSQLFGDDIERCCLPRSVAAIQDGERLKIKPCKPCVDEGIKGVEAGVAGALDRHAKIPLLILRGKNNVLQIQHSPATSSAFP